MKPGDKLLLSAMSVDIDSQQEFIVFRLVKNAFIIILTAMISGLIAYGITYIALSGVFNRWQYIPLPSGAKPTRLMVNSNLSEDGKVIQQSVLAQAETGELFVYKTQYNPRLDGWQLVKPGTVFLDGFENGYGERCGPSVINSYHWIWWSPERVLHQIDCQVNQGDGNRQIFRFVLSQRQNLWLWQHWGGWEVVIALMVGLTVGGIAAILSIIWLVFRWLKKRYGVYFKGFKFKRKREIAFSFGRAAVRNGFD